MLTVVVALNVLISLLCFYVAWQLWNVRRALAVAADAVANAERDTYNVLHGAPNAIGQGQVGIQGLRVSYQQLEIQLQRVQQVLALLSLVQSLVPVVTRSSTRLRQRNRVEAVKSQSRSRRLRRQQRSRG